MTMTHKLSSALLRRWSMKCAAQADSAAPHSQKRQRLLQMRASLIDLADAQDWLDGKSAEAGPSRPHNFMTNRIIH